MGAAPSYVYGPSSSFEDRLKFVFIRTGDKVSPEAKSQLLQLVSPDSLKIVAAVLVAWILAHAFGLGEIIDAILLVGGALSIGWAIFDGVDHLYDFAKLTYTARSSHDLEMAADHLAKAIAILGIQAVMAVIFRGAKAPRTGRGGRLNIGPAPAEEAGLRYKPKVFESAAEEAGGGFTSWWGDITISSKGSQTDRALVLLHEQVHQFFVPKLKILREYRVTNRAGSYVRSSLYRFLEELLAETIARVGINGFSEVFIGLCFPVRNGYVFWMKAGSAFEATWKGSGVIVEGAALIHNGVVSGFAYNLLFAATQP